MNQLFRAYPTQRSKAGIVQSRITLDERHLALPIPLPLTARLVEGKPRYCAEALPRNAKPNLKLLSDFLKGNEPIPDEVRHWLADLFDPDADNAYKLKMLQRNPGAKRAGLSNNWDAAKHADRLMEYGDHKWETAVQGAAEKFGISASAVEIAIKSYRLAHNEHSQLNMAHAKAAPDN